MTNTPTPPLPVDPKRAVDAIRAAYSQAEKMVVLHWQPDIEKLDDQGASHRIELKTLVTVLDGAGVDIEPLTTAWRKNWEAYRDQGGVVEFTPIGDPDWRTRGE